MSADNWRACPNCMRGAVKELHERQKKADDAYGKVSAAEFLRLRKEAEKPIEFDDQTLREDWEILTDSETGEFFVSYSCHCSMCGLAFSFKHTESVFKKRDS